MPENPGNYRAIPPVTIVTKSPTGQRVAATNIGAMPQVHVTPTAMADPEQAARLVSAMQKQTATLAAQQTSDPHSGRAILRDVDLAAGIPLAVIHGLLRPFVGWAWNRPRLAAPAIIEQPATLAQPADKFLLLLSVSTCRVDLEVW